jgi:tetratricopeptide (TPR) repeat protein
VVTDTASDDVRLGRYREALILADQGIAAVPNNPWAHYNRAIALGRLGRTDESVEAYRTAERHFGGNRIGQAISLYGRAQTLANAGQCGDAKKAFGEYINFVTPFDPGGAANAREVAENCRPLHDEALGQVYALLTEGRYGEALKVSDRVSKIWRSTGWFEYGTAIALGGVGRTDDAVAAFRRAELQFTEDPHQRAIMVYNRARVLDLAGRCDEARRGYDEYTQMVRASSPSDAGMASAAARRCVPK